MWESGNINTHSSKTAEDNKVGETQKVSQYLVIMQAKKNRHKMIAKTRDKNGMKI